MADLDSAMRARVAGRQEIARRTVWSVTIGALEVRCVRRLERDKSPFLYVVQGRSSRRWERVGAGDDAMRLLRALIESQASERALFEAIREAAK